MAKIHYMKDKDGNMIYPVTHADAILGLEDVGSNVDLSDYQTKIDDNLVTQSKDLVGAINELFQNANSGKELIADAIGEPVSAEDTFQAMSDKINTVKSNLKQVLTDEGVDVTEEDDMDSLITKVDEEFDRQNEEMSELEDSVNILTNEKNDLEEDAENTRSTLAAFLHQSS